MDKIRTATGKIVGIVAAVAFVALGLYSCVGPFFSNDAVSYTCEDDELSEGCDQDGTFLNFFVVMCGRDEVRLEGNEIRYIGGEPGVREPSDVVGEYWCGARRYIHYEVSEVVFNRGDFTYEIMKEGADRKSQAVFVVYERWVQGSVGDNEARRALLSIN